MSNYYKYAAVNTIEELNSDMNFEQYSNSKEKRFDKFRQKEISIEDAWPLIRSIAPKSS